MKIKLVVLVLVFLVMGLKVSRAETEAIEKAIIEQDYFTAIHLAERYLEQEREDKDRILFLLAEAYIEMSDLPQARETLRVIYKDYPESDYFRRAVLRIADTHYMGAHYEQALKIYNYFLEKVPDKDDFLPYAYLKLAYCNEKIGDWHKKRYYMEKLKKEFPESIESSKLEELKKRGFAFVVQVGAFVDSEHAKSLVGQMKEKGFSPYIAEEKENGRVFYKVRIGKFTEHKEAESKLTELLSCGYPARIFP